MSLSELIIDIPAEYEMNVFGQFDTYIKKIERTFHVTLISRDGATKIVGDTIAAQKTQRCHANDKAAFFHPANPQIVWNICSSSGHTAASTRHRPASPAHHARVPAPASSQRVRT